MNKKSEKVAPPPEHYRACLTKKSLPNGRKILGGASFERYFEQVWVINLSRRNDRLENFWKELDKSRWPFCRPKVFSAIEGNKVGVPRYWQTGGGSYGCLRSHLVLLERAIQDDVQSILVLEDDAVFMNTFGEEVAGFLEKVPSDWQCLMLGGQHVNSQPVPIGPGIVRAGGGGGIQRTHCYALRGREIMKELYRVWANAAVHCDWVMGPCTARFNTYAPDPFLVGQSNGPSDISGQNNPVKFWRSPSGTEPVVVLRAPRSVMEALRTKGWHGGYNRDPGTGIDVGLRDLFVETTSEPAMRKTRLKHWIDMIQGEVVSMTERAICTVWHPDVRIEMVRSVVRGKVVEIAADTAQEALAQLPADIHEVVSASANKINVVLLRAPRATMDILRQEGWHNGHWRDQVTGQDNGIRRLFASTSDKTQRKAGLFAIVRTLHDEAQDIPEGLATVWHDEITLDMLENDGVQPVEITATDADEAKTMLKEISNARQSKSR